MFGIFQKSARHRRESAIGKATLGGMMVLAAFPVLFINEGRAVKTARALQEGAASVVSVSADLADAANEGKLIHVSGQAVTKESLADESFGVTVDAIRLTRTVQMYQWKETETEVTRKTGQAGGKKTKTIEYDYEQVWSDQLIPSDAFQEASAHANPAEMPYASKSWDAAVVTVGDFQLSDDLVSQITLSEPLAVDLSEVPQPLADNLRPDGGTESSAAGFYWSAKPSREETDSEETDSEEASDEGPASEETSSDEPQIGDCRIHYAVTLPAEVSIIAQQSGQRFQAYPTHSGRKLSMLSLGAKTADEMFTQAEAENSALTWMLRCLGTVLMVVGIGLALSLLVSITDWIPILGQIISMGTAVVAIVVGAAFSLLTISVAWLFYRPLIAIPLLVVSVVLLWMLVRMASQNRTPTPPQAFEP